jgi:hypothetical protein
VIPEPTKDDPEECTNAQARHSIAYYALARKKESDAALREFIAKYQASRPYEIAQVYAFRNQSDEAFEWLDRAYAKHDDGLIFTKVDPY